MTGAALANTAPNLLSMTSISRAFAGVHALENVDLDIKPAEVLALVGENGAGKSTLMRILLGLVRPDAGTIAFAGEEVSFSGPSQALHAGISMIHQEISLVPQLSIAENTWLGREPQFARFGLINASARRTATQRLMRELGFELHPDTVVASLSIAEMQLVEIARAVSYGSALIIMDEPSSALSAREIELLYSTIDRLKASGVAIVYISHKLDEVFRVADRIAVLRDGRSVGTFIPTETTRDQLISLIAGRELAGMFRRRTNRQAGERVLEVRSFTSEPDFSDVSFHVSAGEVLGFFGLMGSGRTEIVSALFGMSGTTSGEVFLDSKPVVIREPTDAVKLGMGMVTEDRLRTGAIYSLSVVRNSTLPSLGAFTGPLWLVAGGRELRSYRNVAARLGIKAADPSASISTLSGGNQQRVLISRWLHRPLRVLILDEPTRGIDVGAKADTYELIDALARQGIAIIIVSSEAEELLAICDRIHVVRRGRIVHEVSGDEASQEELVGHAFEPAAGTSSHAGIT